MASRNPPPWLTNRGPPPQRPPPDSSIPKKRTADSRTEDRPAKRTGTTTSAEDAWVADEDRFVLQQTKKKAALRVKNGRATPIDWLAVTLRFVDPTKSLLDDEIEDHDLEVVDPVGLLEGLGHDVLSQLEKDIDQYLSLEKHRTNRDFWKAVKRICKARREDSLDAATGGRGSVFSDIDRMLAPKSYDELKDLELKVEDKLDSDENIDYDYWEKVLRSLRVRKAKAQLRKVSQDVIGERLQRLRKQQEEAAITAQKQLQEVFGLGNVKEGQDTAVAYDATLDPEPALKLHPEEKRLRRTEDRKFMEKIVEERKRIQKLGYVPLPRNIPNNSTSVAKSKDGQQASSTGLSRFAPIDNDDEPDSGKTLYEKVKARGVQEGEEVFTNEEELQDSKPEWGDKFKLRKPLYYNKAITGYEWNKYNQTHYDHDNPPPKVVQGYKFNIFYPDLIDKRNIPTFKIIREHGRKRGESFAPAGEDDTCLIRFTASPPYEDIAFRIVDREWDYSGKRDRGFKNDFEKGILQLHFQFKKIYYRK